MKINRGFMALVVLIVMVGVLIQAGSWWVQWDPKTFGRGGPGEHWFGTGNNPAVLAFYAQSVVQGIILVSLFLTSLGLMMARSADRRLVGSRTQSDSVNPFE